MAIPIPPELIASLAVKLISKWKADPNVEDALIPVKDNVILGLKRLIGFDDLVIPEADRKRKTANDTIISLAINAISKFQREIAPNLDVDGFLGNQTFNEILKVIRCADGVRGPSSATGTGFVDFTPSSELRERVEIWVYIDGESLPRVTNQMNQPRSATDNIFDVKAAAISWSFTCNIRFLFPEKADKEKAHVWVVGENLPDSSTLALADLWPTSGFLTSKLKLRFNTNRTFVSKHELGSPVFFGTAIHEFGHILGLSHSYPDGHTAPAGEMMHPAHQPNLETIPDADKLRIQKIWGAPS